MAFKLVAVLALLASCSAGIINPHQTYSDAPSVSYSSISFPTATHDIQAAPVHKISAPLTYAAPSYKIPAPVSFAAPLSYAGPAYKIAAPVANEPFDPAHYDFSYAVEDPHTGDFKSHHETREGDVTKGSYSLLEADGTRRIVEYTVDAHSGFNAVVHREPAQAHGKAVAPLVAKVGVPVGLAVPAIKIAAPLAVLAKVPALTKVNYSSAPEVSYSSYSNAASQVGDSGRYYH